MPIEDDSDHASSVCHLTSPAEQILEALRSHNQREPSHEQGVQFRKCGWLRHSGGIRLQVVASGNELAACSKRRCKNQCKETHHFAAGGSGPRSGGAWFASRRALCRQPPANMSCWACWASSWGPSWGCPLLWPSVAGLELLDLATEPRQAWARRSHSRGWAWAPAMAAACSFSASQTLPPGVMDASQRCQHQQSLSGVKAAELLAGGLGQATVHQQA